MDKPTTCRVAECDRPVKYKTESLCNAHYLQWHRGKPFSKPRHRSGNIGDNAEQVRDLGYSGVPVVVAPDGTSHHGYHAGKLALIAEEHPA